QWRIVFTVVDPRRNEPNLCITVRNLDGARVEGGCFKQNGTTFVYKAGTFYLDINSAHIWSVAVEQNG
ncbi:MAG: hypothetical protein QOF51_772, partial [Chloroflexota bacterium]|nr:hypothetical protein [Chloroflexota bacterium]